MWHGAVGCAFVLGPLGEPSVSVLGMAVPPLSGGVHMLQGTGARCEGMPGVLAARCLRLWRRG